MIMMFNSIIYPAYAQNTSVISMVCKVMSNLVTTCVPAVNGLSAINNLTEVGAVETSLFDV